MMEAAAELLGLAGPTLWLAGAVFLRVGAMMALLPAFGEQSVPVRVRLALALAFTAIVTPAVAPLMPREPPGWQGAPLWLLTETVSGLALGLALRLFVVALQTAGAIAAHATSLSQLLGPAALEPLPAMGQLMVVGGLALAALAGLHVKLVELMVLSYRILPPGGVPPPGDIAEWGVAQVARAFALAFSLAAPFVVASFLYNLALGAINRAMPQLMVAFVGAPVITAGGLVLLALALPALLGVWLAAFDAFLARPMAP